MCYLFVCHNATAPLIMMARPEDIPVDIVVKGEGEAIFTDLVATVRNEGDLSNVEGIVYRKDEQIVENLSIGIK